MPVDKLFVAASHLQVSPYYLATGEEMENEPLREDEKHFIEMLRSLNHDGRVAAVAVMSGLVNRYPKDKPLTVSELNIEMDEDGEYK